MPLSALQGLDFKSYSLIPPILEVFRTQPCAQMIELH
uniref:Uncharacterized protein n=1 Tax=Siphoviridae sp. ctOba29 TaxID=2825480 RepID=A0A8S5NXJ5_9CAUD|nr:MAG TPA: hypothetical protein [Siphoviridae sp. ctOba29]